MYTGKYNLVDFFFLSISARQDISGNASRQVIMKNMSKEELIETLFRLDTNTGDILWGDEIRREINDRNISESD